jgi:tRNA pseudouridine55 synthase
MNGFLVIDKPEDWTSHDVVQKARKELKIKKIGHLGTLDPLATGVLVLAVGNATKLIEYLLMNEKEYDAEVKLGVRSDTFDAEGKIEEVTDKPVSEKEIEKVVSKFEGSIDQVPPVFSAIKIEGETAYKKARRGEDIKMKPKKVHIYENKILDYKWPVLKLHIHCSTGTYIRSIAHDIGEKLGCGGYLQKLVRTRVRNFQLKDSIKIEEISPEKLIPIEEALPAFPQVELTELDYERIKNGQGIVKDGNWSDEELIAGMLEGKLVSVMAYNAKYKVLRSKKFLSQ